MATHGDIEVVTVSAGADLSAAQFKVIDVAGTISAANNAALGVLQNKPKLGESACVAYNGHVKAFVGAAVTKGARVKTTTSRYLVTVASGDGACGKTLAAANSGSLVDVLVDFTNAATTY